jgi:hypothetical protein
MTKTLNQIIFFSSTKIRIFFSATLGIRIFFYSDKCNVLSITRNKTPVKCPYTLHGHQLEHADKAKYLGVTIQSDLIWDSHIYGVGPIVR